MGTEAFEATVADVQSERETRERDRIRRAGRMYRELTGYGMSDDRASALVHSVFFTDDPQPVTMTFVEHTGVFGLWDDSTEMWLCAYGMVIHGPRCVVLAHLRTYNTVNSDIAPGLWQVCEFAPDGTPIIEDEVES